MGELEGPVSQGSWSPDFLAQTLELVVVHRADGGIVRLRPVHAPSLQLAWRPGPAAETVLREALARYGLATRILHSTSWRQVGDRVVLTYLAVVDPPAAPNPNLVPEAVGRTELARGAATAAPAAIALEQVLEHALRHLAWLIADDPAVAEALPGWSDLLDGYLPEPFRQI